MSRLYFLAALSMLFAHVAVAANHVVDSWPLQETRPPNRVTSPPAMAAPRSIAEPRVLIVGDSWAQYMWDDGSYENIFDKWGHNDKMPLSRSLGADPGPGYSGSEYAVSQSEARHWVDTANYPWIANMVAELQAHPTIDVVVLSIGGNDVLAGRPGGGWYKDMDLDTAGSEAAFFSRLQNDTFSIINAAKAVRADIEVLISSYDYPNFNVGFWCFIYACPKRNDLSRDPANDLITDSELNGMMVTIESERIGWANLGSGISFDHSVGLLHHYFGDGISGPGLLPHPGQTPPAYLPFPGGNPLRPTLRSLFRKPGGLDADPIHLSYTGYQYKITNQTETHFFPRFRGAVSATFFSLGGASDGWTDGTVSGTNEIRLGDNGTSPYYGILTFDTSSIPDGALVTAASIYLMRESAVGTNPFTSGDLGTVVIDVVSGSFGAPGVETSDTSATADAGDTGYTAGTASSDHYAVRIDITGSGLAVINDQGTTQIRAHFPAPGTGSSVDQVSFYDGDAGLPSSSGLRTLADHMGSAIPFLDVSYYVPNDDTDSDGDPDISDTDDDNDGVADTVDDAPLDPDVCEDSDSDSCDDCSIGVDDFGILSDNTPFNDGTDTDSDGMCNTGDDDDDNDGISDNDELTDTDADGVITDPLNPDTDGDGILDSWDRFPRVADHDNALGDCGGDMATIVTPAIIGAMTCIATTRIETMDPVVVDGDDFVNGPGDLLLISPTVRLNPGFSVEANGRLTVISADPNLPPPQHAAGRPR